MTCKSPDIQSPERTAILQWVARIGAVTDQALAAHTGATVASARARLLAAGRAGLLVRHRPLTGRPSLYTATRAGMRVSGLGGLDLCRVSSSNALHLIECARIAAALEGCYADYRVLGERELRSDERERGRALASARLGEGLRGGPALHRPDLVLWSRRSNGELPVAVEVELTIKAPRRLLEICRAWARCRCVAGVLYLAPPEVERALARAVERAQAEERIAVVPLDALPTLNGGSPVEIDP
ncbi:MAG TPA: hypothetical protein VGL79_06895 [Solirubrobacteraceae bacterium]|jgi:hypothetical protein